MKGAINKPYSGYDEKSEAVERFCKMCSGKWSQAHKDICFFHNIDSIKRNTQNYSSSTSPTEIKDKHFILSFPSFRLLKHFEKPHRNINKQELQEIAISQLSHPCQLIVPEIQETPNNLLSDLPKYIIQNIFCSLHLLIDARVRSYALILLRHYDYDQCVQNKVISLLKFSNIRIASASVNFEIDESDSDTKVMTDEDGIITVPIIFKASIDLHFPMVHSMEMIKVSLNSRGSIKGSFNESNNIPELYSLSMVMDSKGLMKTLINKARFVAQQAVQFASSFHMNAASANTTTELIAKEKRSGSILLNHNKKTSSKRKKVSFSETPELSSENSLPSFSSIETVLLPTSATLSTKVDKDTESIAIIDSAMEVWDLSLNDKDSKRRKLSSAAAVSFIQSY